MKKLALAVLLATSLTAVAEEKQERKGYYVDLKLTMEDSKTGADANKYGMTFGKHVYDWLDAEIYTRIKDKDDNTNDTKIEGAVIPKLKLTDNLSAYARLGVGEKFKANDDFGYWTAEPGLKYKLNSDWSVKAGVRFRDSFQTSHNANDTTYKAGVSYKLASDTSLGLGYSHKTGDSKADEFGLSLKFEF